MDDGRRCPFDDAWAEAHPLGPLPGDRGKVFLGEQGRGVRQMAIGHRNPITYNTLRHTLRGVKKFSGREDLLESTDWNGR